MTYTVYEQSRKTGSPVTLYRFRVGSSAAEVYTYTDSDQQKLYNDGGGLGELTYEPTAITRGRISASGTLDRSKLEIRLPDTAAFADILRGYPPAGVIGVIVFEGHADDPDTEYVVAWVGRVLGSKLDTPAMILTCEPAITSMRRSGLRRNWQYGCPHQLYDSETCKADITYATVTGTVAAISGTVVTLDPGWNGAFATTAFRHGGRLEWDTPAGDREIRTIRRVSGDVLTLNAPTRELVVTDSVDVRLGCNHQSTDCENLHRETGTANPNINNYGGQLYIPFVSPIGLKNNFY